MNTKPIRTRITATLLTLIFLISILSMVQVQTVYAHSLTQSLPPNATGDVDNWSVNSGTKVAAVTSDDGDTTYIYSFTTNQMQLFQITDLTGTPSITKVKIDVEAREFGHGGKLKIIVKTGGDTFESTEKSLSSSYHSESWTLNDNPKTDSDWTASEVNALQVGVKRTAGTVRVTLITVTVTVGNTAPSAPSLISPANGSVTNDTTPTFSWNAATDPDGDTLTYRLQVDDNKNFNNNEIDITTSATSYTPSSPLSADVYYWRVRATDEHNLSGDYSSTRTLTIDTAPPSAPTLISPANGAATSNNKPTFDWTDVTDPSGVTYTLQVSNDGFSTFVIDQSGLATSEFTPITPLDDNTYSWRVRAVDGAGNVGAFSSTFTFTVDTGNPTVDITYPTDGSYLNTGTFTVTGTSSNGLSGVDNVTVKVDGGTWVLANDTASWTCDVGPLSDGPHTITANATDNVGNWATTNVTITVDTVNPTVDITYPTDGSYLGTDFTITGTSADIGSGVNKVEVQIDSGPWVTATTTDQWANWSYNVASLSNGSHTITANATDKAGNWATSTVTVNIDLTIPSVSITSPTNGQILEIRSFVVSGTSSNGASGVNKVEVQIDGGSWVTATTTDQWANWSYNVASLSNGLHTITANATDNVGNSLTTSVTITVAVPTWPPEPYIEPVNLTEVRGNADTILSLGEAVPAGDDPTLLELDYNGDGFVNIADAFDQFVDAGLLRQPSWSFDPDAASQYLAMLESVYGENLENFQPVEGRVWLLYMLTYLPYQ